MCVDTVFIPLELRCLQPFRTVLVRLGGNFDGGYAVPVRALQGVTSCVSIGLGRNWNFERCLKDRFGVKQIVVYDGSVGLLTFASDILAALRDFVFRRRKFEHFLKNFTFCCQYLNFFRGTIVHEKKMIVETLVDDSQLSINTILNQIHEPEKTIVKIDIEGDEYGLSRQLLDSAKFRRSRIVIMEWHETEKQRVKFLEFVRNMAESHYLVHLHENNFSPLADDSLPVTLELVWQCKSIEVLNERVEKLPITGVDSPNNRSKPTQNFRFL